MTKKSDQPGMNRRQFIGGAVAVTGAVSVAPGVFLHAVAAKEQANTGASSDKRWGMVVDTNKCADGCKACVDACNDEHNLTGFDRPATDAQWSIAWS